MSTFLADPYKEGRRARLLQALEHRYERTSRITSMVGVNVRILKDKSEVPPGMEDVPGWTDGDTIHLNEARINAASMTGDALVSALGVNYHELAHVLYTPMVNSNVGNLVQSAGVWHWYNVLEDQRAESLFVAKYPAAAKFFTATVARFLSERDAQWKSNYALVYGRKFLPKSVVAAFKDRFMYPEHLSTIEALIDEYRLLLPREQPERARDICVEMSRLFRAPASNSLHGNSGYDNASKTTDKHYNADDERAAREKAAEVDEHADDEELSPDGEGETDEASDGDGNGAGEASEDAAEGESSPDGEGDADGEGTEAEGESSSEGDGTSEAESTDDGGKGAGKGAPDASTARGLRDLLDETAKSAESSEEAQREVESARDAAVAPPGPYHPEGLPSAVSPGLSPVTLEDLGVITRVSQKLRDMQTSSETTLNVGVRHGSLNPMLFERAQPGDLEVFDQWKPGVVGEDGALEVALLLDTSSSMRSVIGQASFAVYALKRAFTNLHDTTVTAFTYSTEHRLLSGRDEAVPTNGYPRLLASGGTVPLSALRESIRMFATTRAKRRLMVVVTDGSWQWDGGDPQVNEKAIDTLNNMGVTTACLGLAGAVSKFGTHHCKVGRDISAPDEMVDFAADLVLLLMEEAKRDAASLSM